MFMKHCIILFVKQREQLNLYKKILNITDGTLHMGKHIWVVKYCVSGLTRTY